MQIKEFLNSVCEQIQYKGVHTQISEEMENHLTEAKETYMLTGMSEEQAEEKATQQMGNAEEIGRKLNKIHRPKLDWKLLLITVVLLGFGALVTFTRSTVLDFGNSICRYGLGLLLGSILAVGIYFIDYRKIFKKPEILYGVATLFMILVLNFGWTVVNGNRAYFSIFGYLIFAPAVVVPIYMLAFIGFLQKINWDKNFKISFAETKEICINFDVLKIVFLSGISLFSLILVPATPLMIILGMIYLIIATVKLLEVKKNRKKYIAILWGVPIIFGILFISFVLPMTWERLIVSFVPEQDPKGGGWIGINQKIILKSANLFGEADDMSNALTMFDEGTNFAFISILAHYGWIPSLAMVTAIVMFSIKLMMNAIKIKDMYGKLLIVGVAGLFIFQSIFNLLMNLNLGIKSNINIPFISYGNMDLIVNLVCLSLALSVYRRKDILLEDTKKEILEN